MTADITIVGLGPGSAELRTVTAKQTLDSAQHIFVRSHVGVNLNDLLHLPHVTDLEPLHDLHAGNRWLRAAEAVLEYAQNEPVVLAIPGHPRFGEGLVRIVLKMAVDRELSTHVIDGLSATDMLASALDIDPILDRVQLFAGRSMVAANDQAPFAGGILNLNPRLPMLITHVYSGEILAAVQTQLMRVLPADHPVVLITAAGSRGESREELTLANLANHHGDPMLAIYVPPQGELSATRTSSTLQHIVARLRQPNGCPWDREQSNQSLAQSLVDEVYEVVDSIDAYDDANLCEELGDLLLLIMMHAQIAEERGAFQLEDVYHGISTKIVRRHPHVFGDLAADNADDVIQVWHAVKQQENDDNPAKPKKAVDGQPHSMPALHRATRVLKKHPIAAPISTAETRQKALLDAVAAVVVAGDDLETVLRDALRNHVSAVNAAPD